MLITRNAERNFGPTGVDGVDFCGLRMNDTEGGAAVIKMKKGARFPTHTHKSDEQTLILSGSAVIGGERLEAGDYLFTETGETHDVVAAEDVVMYVTVEKGIEIIEA
jgi:quercetin dioxygenase-like cupin family protein